MQRIVVVLLLMASALPCPALVSTNVPLDHWSYDAVDKLAGYGFIESAMLTTKPISRIEMARHIAQAMDHLEREDDSPAVLATIIERLKKEFETELILIDAVDGSPRGSFVKPVEDPYAKYLHAQTDIDMENASADTFRRGSNYRAGFASRGQFFERFAFYLHPEYADSSKGGAGVDLIEGYGIAMAGPVAVEAGKDSLWWGPGRHGSILMSNNAEPFKMVKVTNPQPLLLPWIFRRLGPLRAEWFLAEMGRDRAIPDARLSGIRVNMKPTPLSELAFSRVSMFGGRGMPRVGLRQYARMFLAMSEQAENNQLAGFDGSLLFPLGSNKLLRSVKLYTDAAGEDESGGMPSKWSYIVGIQANDIFRTGRTDLRFEYTNGHGALYTHDLYASGYTYRDRMIGHHAGTDARDVFVELSHYLMDDLLVAVALDHQTATVSSDIQPQRNMLECNLMWFPSSDWQIRAGYRYEDVDTGGGDNHLLQIQLIREF